jgi:cell division protein FtsI/penicillin-binding protein 2
MFEFRLSSELKRRKIKLYQKEDIEPQETLLDSLAQKREEELGISEKRIETPLSKNVLQGFLISILILIFFLFARVFQFQVIEGKEFTILSERNKFTIYQIEAERGVIYDSKGNQLVWNNPSFDLVLNKNDFPQEDSQKNRILKEVSTILDKNPEEMKREIEEKGESEILISENLSRETLVLLEAKIGDLPGFQIRNTTSFCRFSFDWLYRKDK